MTQPLDEAYFRYLYGTVASARTRVPAKSYWSLMRKMYTTEFVWLVPNDDNRVADGIAIRDQWAMERGGHHDQEWLDAPCSFLEMLVALSDRIAFEEGGSRPIWFWHLLENLGLAQVNDATYDKLYEQEIGEILERVIRRHYRENGQGGLFPLRYAEEDQRLVELWYQKEAYLMERDV